MDRTETIARGDCWPLPLRMDGKRFFAVFTA